MIGVLIVAGIIFYALLYSGIKELGGEKISTLDALLGKDSSTGKAPTTGPPTKIANPTKVGGKK